MWVRKIRDAFGVEICLEVVDRISAGNRKYIQIGGEGLNKATDTEKFMFWN